MANREQHDRLEREIQRRRDQISERIEQLRERRSQLSAGDRVTVNDAQLAQDRAEQQQVYTAQMRELVVRRGAAADPAGPLAAGALALARMTVRTSRVK